jgi:hypothetical protein
MHPGHHSGAVIEALIATDPMPQQIAQQDLIGT